MKPLGKVYNNPSIGCYVDESSGSADDCNERTIKFAESYGFPAGEWQDEITEDSDDYSQALSELADDAVSFLNECETRSYMAWQHEDNSLFLIADVESAREDVGFVSSKEQDYPPAEYRGEWLHVSDHGNATLYVRDEDGKDVEIWSAV